jgi:hypothetical protein
MDEVLNPSTEGIDEPMRAVQQIAGKIHHGVSVE